MWLPKLHPSTLIISAADQPKKKVGWRGPACTYLVCNLYPASAAISAFASHLLPLTMVSQLAKVHSSTTHFANNSNAVQLYYTHTSCYFEQLPPILPKLFVSDWHRQCETESWAGKLRVMEIHYSYTSRALNSQATAKWKHVTRTPSVNGWTRAHCLV